MHYIEKLMQPIKLIYITLIRWAKPPDQVPLGRSRSPHFPHKEGIVGSSPTRGTINMKGNVL